MRWSTLCTMVIVSLCLAGCGGADSDDGGEGTAKIDTTIIKPKNPAPMPGATPPAGAGAPTAPAADPRFAIGKVAPDIVAEDIDGVEFKLSDYRGKVVMLDFWGDW